MDDMEVKADALDGAFDAVLAAEAVDELKASVAALKAQVERQAVAASRSTSTVRMPTLNAHSGPFAPGPPNPIAPQ